MDDYRYDDKRDDEPEEKKSKIPKVVKVFLILGVSALVVGGLMLFLGVSALNAEGSGAVITFVGFYICSAGGSCLFFTPIIWIATANIKRYNRIQETDHIDEVVEDSNMFEDKYMDDIEIPKRQSNHNPYNSEDFGVGTKKKKVKKFCKYCGNRIDEGADYCTSCGRKI